MAMMGVHPSFGFRLLCRVNLAREVLCCSLKSHSDGIGCVAGSALAVPIVTGRGENFGVRVRHGRGRAAAAIKAAFLRGEECPDKDRSLLRRCIGDPGRDEHIYGGYAGTTVVLRVPALPDSCILPVSVSQPAIVEAGLRRRSRGDLSLVQRSGRSTRSRAEVVVADGGFFGTVVRAGSELRSTARTFGGLVAGRGEAQTGFV
jgi:hypothetical protein